MIHHISDKDELFFRETEIFGYKNRNFQSKFYFIQKKKMMMKKNRCIDTENVF